MEERKKYPIGPESYDLLEEIGQGVSASVYRALCVPIDETVAIKILDFERDNCDLSNISREAQTMILVDHPNVVKAHCSFVSGHNLWVVMPFMAGGSCLHILKAAYPDGFSEVVISTILREVLKGLEYLHHHGRIHRDVKAGNILLDARGTIKLGDFGVSACLFDSGDRQRTRNTFVGTPCWMAPEVMEQLHGYDFKADIWSFGITALELAHGHAPFSKYPPMKVLLMTLQNAPPGLDYERDRKFSKSFKQMVAMCLVKDPSKRPSAHKLLKHSFFKQARPNEYIARTILDGLPTLGDRIRALKIKEEDMLAQKKMPDGRKEELSQDEYKRGISGWNFNIEDLKTQAALIQDGEEVINDKYRVGSSNALYELDQMNQYDAADKEDDNAVQNNSASMSLADLTEEYLKGRCDPSEDDSSIAGSTNEHNASQGGLHVQVDHIGNSFTERPEHELKQGKLEDSDKQPNQGLNIISNNEVAVPTAVDDAISEPLNRTLKSSASNGEDYDEKGKVSVVQQKGRFKVTSENVNLEKAPPSPSPCPIPMLQKSHSMQVITQFPAVGLQPSSDATSSNTSGSSFLPELHSMLRANISQRDSILYLMKQLSHGNFKALCPTDGSSGSLPTITEKSLLELAHDKEKDLLHEVTELQWRLISTQEELQRYKMKNSQI